MLTDKRVGAGAISTAGREISSGINAQAAIPALALPRRVFNRYEAIADHCFATGELELANKLIGSALKSVAGDQALEIGHCDCRKDSQQNQNDQQLNQGEA